MTVSVKLVVFKHPEPARWDTYASYCPATCDFCAFGKSVSEVVEKFKKTLFRDLQNRLAYKNMKIWGWEVFENSAIPPIFADEYIVKETERVFEVTINEPIIIKVDVELPRAEKTI
jgi:hypothetical protein